MAAVRSVNVGTWNPADYAQVYVPIVQDAILPDPGTGSLYGSTVPMQDTPHVYASVADIPGCPPLVNLGGYIQSLIPTAPAG